MSSYNNVLDGLPDSLRDRLGPKENQVDLTITSLVAGFTGCGKSTLVNQIFGVPEIVRRKLNANKRVVIYESQKDGLSVQNTIWEAKYPQMEDYNMMGGRMSPPAYYGRIDVAYVVLDVTQSESVKYVDKWMTDISLLGHDKIYTVLVANKTDLVSERCVTREEGEALALKYSVPYFETSSKDNASSRDMFEHGISMVYSEFDDVISERKDYLEEVLLENTLSVQDVVETISGFVTSFKDILDSSMSAFTPSTGREVQELRHANLFQRAQFPEDYGGRRALHVPVVKKKSRKRWLGKLKFW